MHRFTTLPLPALCCEIVFAAHDNEIGLMALNTLANAIGTNIHEEEAAVAVSGTSIVLHPAGTLPESTPYQRIATKNSFVHRMLLDSENNTLFVELKAHTTQSYSHAELIRLARSCLMWGVVLHGRLHGNLTALHGALLQVGSRNGGIVLFGESGVGKSSAANRFCAAGGLCYSDDMVLLSRSAGGEFRAQPLPTWSRWQELDRESRYATCSGKAVKVCGVWRLIRGENDRVEPGNPIQWELALFRALNYFPSLQSGVDGKIKQELAKNAMELVSQIHREFGHLDLHGDLNGKLFIAVLSFMNRQKTI